MAKMIAALCLCGKPPIAGIAVSVYRFDVKKQKVSRTFHICADCASEMEISTPFHQAFKSSYKALDGASK